MARYWNPVTELVGEVVTVGTVEHLYEGGVRPSDYDTHPWMCNSCKLVWGRKWQAINCARPERKHRNQYRDTYYYQVTIEGQPQIIEQSYIRQAIRRNGPRPGTPVVTEPTAATPELERTIQAYEADPSRTLEAAIALVKASGFRVSRKPAPKPVPEFELTETPEEPVF